MSSPDDRKPNRTRPSDSLSTPYGESSVAPPDNGSRGAEPRPSRAQERIAETTRTAANEAKQSAEAAYRETSHVAADTSDAIDEAARALGGSGHQTLSEATAALSDRVRTFSRYLEGRRLEDLLTDARGLAQRNPGLFVAGGVGLGFVLSRLLKAGATQRTNRSRHAP